MRFKLPFLFLLTAGLLFATPFKSIGQIDLAQYGLEEQQVTAGVAEKVAHQIDSIYSTSAFMEKKAAEYGSGNPKINTNKTLDFYILLALVLFLGVIRFVDPKYLLEVWTAYFNASFSRRSLREKIEQSNVPNALMNIFFVLCFGTYLYYVVKNMVGERIPETVAPFLVLVIAGGVVVVYAVKYLVIRFTGWAFDIKGVTDTYLFNVFLVNKILAIGLLPFTIVMAFHNTALASVALVLSVVFIFALFISRYVKSWQVLGSFFQYSKFHFFTYLCASEIMPLAILMKFLISKWL